MKASFEAIREQFIFARQDAEMAGVEEEYIDGVASIAAMLQLIGIRDEEFAADDAASPLMLPQTFAEWASDYNLTTHYDRFLAAMVWLFRRGPKTATTTDIREMYDKARWKQPANAADVLAKGAEHMYFAEAEDTEGGNDGLKLWRLTRTGYEYFGSLRFET